KIYTGDTLDTLVPANYFWRGDPRHLELQAVAGTTYRIVAFQTDETEATLNLTVLRPPVNDLFANRTVLDGTNILIEGSLVMAGEEPGEPVPPYGCGYTGRSIWYSWTAPAAGSVWLDAWFSHPENGCVRLA